MKHTNSTVIIQCEKKKDDWAISKCCETSQFCSFLRLLDIFSTKIAQNIYWESKLISSYCTHYLQLSVLVSLKWQKPQTKRKGRGFCAHELVVTLPCYNKKKSQCVGFVCCCLSIATFGAASAFCYFPLAKIAPCLTWARRHNGCLCSVSSLMVKLG